MKALLKILAPVLFNSLLPAQAPDIIWEKDFGGNGDDDANSAVITHEGDGLIITGSKNQDGMYQDLWIVRVNNQGDMIWEKTYGGVNNSVGYGIDIGAGYSTSEGYIITGYIYTSATNSYDLWLLKINDNGDTLWTKTYGGVDGEIGRSVNRESNNYIIVGDKHVPSHNTDVWLLYTDQDGDTLWTKTYGGSDFEYGRCVLDDNSGADGFLIAGTTYSYGAGASDVWLIRTDYNGNINWTKTYGGPFFDEANFIDGVLGVYAACGSFSVNQGESNVWLLRFDINGDTLWTRISGSQLSDRGYFVNINNNLDWLITGSRGTKIFAMKISSNGFLLWEKELDAGYGGKAIYINEFLDEYYLVGTKDFGSPKEDQLIVVKLGYGSSAMNETQPLFSDYQLEQNYPNPFNPSTKIKYAIPESNLVTLKVYDVIGREIATLVNEYKTTGEYEVDFGTDDLNSGIYFYQINSGVYSETKKMVYIK